MRNLYEGMTFASLGYGKDVAPATLSLRAGWHELEWLGGKPFRWIGGEAHALLASSGLAYSFRIDIEPGPGVGSEFVLEMWVDCTMRDSVLVRGRQFVRFSLPPSVPGIRNVRLKVIGGGAPTPGDPRVLDARVFAFVALPVQEDIVPMWDGVSCGRGWNGIELHDNRIGRTMGREAFIEMRHPRNDVRLSLEPVRGLEHEKLVLEVDVAGHHAYRSYRIERTTRIKIDLPEIASFPARIGLRCERDAKPVVPDSRVHNLRFFCQPPPWDRSELLRSLAGTESFTAALDERST